MYFDHFPSSPILPRSPLLPYLPNCYVFFFSLKKNPNPKNFKKSYKNTKMKIKTNKQKNSKIKKPKQSKMKQKYY